MKTLKIPWGITVIAALTLCASAFAASSSSLSPYELYGAWPADNNTSANLGVATTDRILSPSNVSQLKPIFSTFTTGPGTAVQATPVIADGNVYYATGGGKVYSYTESGTLNWSTALTASDGTAEFFDETPVLTKQYVFIAGQQMHKLDRMTGKEVVAPQVYDPAFTPFMPASHIEPSLLMVAGKLVIYGIGFTDETSGNGALFAYAHGEIVAFNQDDLSTAWRIDLSKDPVTGALYGPGSGTFSQGGVDEQRHLVFMGTGNQYAPPSSPLSDSLLAIDYRTGKVVWSFAYAVNDIWGGGGSDLVYDGNHDLDVQGHPQIFSLELIPGLPFTSIDLVGERGKDGTYRIFTRDQFPNHVTPLAQIQLDPATASDGAIQADPVINNNILYIASTSWVNPSNPSVDSSLDFLVATVGNTGAAFDATTRVRAFDIRQLVYYGIQQLLKGNTVPICVGSLLPSRCTGQLPSQIILWQTTLFPASPSSSSGLAYDNGVLFVQSIVGQIYMLKATDGSMLAAPLIAASLPPNPFGLTDAVIGGGVSIDNGKVFVPFGLDFGGFDLGIGGITAFGLPH